MLINKYILTLSTFSDSSTREPNSELHYSPIATPFSFWEKTASDLKSILSIS